MNNYPTRKLTPCTAAAKPEPKTDPPPSPELPPPPHPKPGSPQPGDPPGTPRPSDPPPQVPPPPSPRPVRPRALAVILILLSLVAGAALAQDATPMAARGDGVRDEIGDDDILEAVETELQSDDLVAADPLDVQVDEGIVKLSGRARTLLVKRRAVRLVGNLKGVRAVVDRTRVVPSGRSDEQILADVKATLRDDPVVEEGELQVEVRKGRVTLMGTVESLAERHLTASTVAGVRGVVGIDNQLVNAAKTQRPDSEIKPEILRRLELSPFLIEDRISVQVQKGVVTLAGTVRSVRERNLARALALVAGVNDVVVDELKVDWASGREQLRHKLSVARNDVELQKAVQDALLYDPRVRGAEIEVRTQQGSVSLIGRVSSLVAKRAAEQDARNTLGVSRVVNNLEVKVSDWPGDVVVTQRVREALARDAHLAAAKLRASSHFGTVYLEGEVSNHFESQRAEVVVANVRGVMDLANRLTVNAAWQPKPDGEIQGDIERRLRWSPILAADQIHVSTNAGEVTLRGQVDSRQERITAAQHARQSGARRVINRLEVRTPK